MMRTLDDFSRPDIEEACRLAGREPKSTPLGRRNRALWDRRIARLYANSDDPADVKIVARYYRGEFDKPGRPFKDVWDRFNDDAQIEIVRQIKRMGKCSLRCAVEAAAPLLQLDAAATRRLLKRLTR